MTQDLERAARATPDNVERAREIIPPRFVTDIVELNPLFTARVALEERLRSDIALALDAAEQHGREQAAQWCDSAYEQTMLAAAVSSAPDDKTKWAQAASDFATAATAIRALTPAPKETPSNGLRPTA